MTSSRRVVACGVLSVAVVATVRAQEAITALPTVDVFGASECVAPGVPESSADSTSSRVVTALLALGAQHRAVVTDSTARVRFLYGYSSTSPRGTDFGPPPRVFRRREQALWKYELGPVRRTGQDFEWDDLYFRVWKPTERYEYDGLTVRVPQVAQLTSAAFVQRHCFRATRVGGQDSGALYRVAFRAPEGTRFIEFNGELLVDLGKGEVREARLELSRLPDWGEPIELWELRLGFSRRDGAASVVDSAVSTQRFKRTPEYRGNLLTHTEFFRRLPQ